jgi:hypothetical protein
MRLADCRRKAQAAGNRGVCPAAALPPEQQGRRSLDGEILADRELWHLYTINNGLIPRMDPRDSDETSQESPSSAFLRR